MLQTVNVSILPTIKKQDKIIYETLAGSVQYNSTHYINTKGRRTKKIRQMWHEWPKFVWKTDDGRGWFCCYLARMAGIFDTFFYECTCCGQQKPTSVELELVGTQYYCQFSKAKVTSSSLVGRRSGVLHSAVDRNKISDIIFKFHWHTLATQATNHPHTLSTHTSHPEH